MNAKTSFGEKLFSRLNEILLFIIIVITLYPFLHVFFASISDPFDFSKHIGILWRPVGFSLIGYKYVFENPMVMTGYLNTIKYVIVGTSINLLLTSIFAYALSRKFLLRKAIILIVIFTLFFSGGLIPTYLFVRNLGLMNKIWALVLPMAISTWNLIILRTGFMSVPDSIDESAKIDGANDFVILFKIMIPLIMPIISVIALFYSVGHWNGWFDALIYIRSRDRYPLQLVLREILIQNDTSSMMTDVSDTARGAVSELIKYATVIVATLPIVCVYPMLQKYFVKGVLIGSVKG